LMHTWYLGIVAEFYIIIPLLFIIPVKLFKKADKQTLLRRIFVLLTVCFAFSLVLYLLPSIGYNEKFYFIPFRFFELALGSMIAFAYSKYGDKTSHKTINIISVVLLIGLMFINSDTAETFNTGKMVYGNADPESKDFNSLADFCVKGDFIEIKLPWQIFNFSDPSRMRIHDDYYEHHDIREMAIKEIYAGVSGEKNEMIEMYEVPLKGWGKDVTYHERLKSSYYTMQKIWR